MSSTSSASADGDSNGFVGEQGRESIIDGEAGVDGCDGDGYVEIEQVNEEEGSVHYVNGHSGEFNSAPPQRVIIKHIAKRTMITFQQRAVLEEFYQKGMTSASYQLDILHQSAAERTGLDITVIKNWIRNRRRPKVIERLGDSAAGAPPTIAATYKPVSVSPYPITAVPTQPGTILVTRSSTIATPPPPKRACVDTNSCGSSCSSVHPSDLLPLLVKVRVADSGENDFVEVEFAPPTYVALLRACCEELELQPSDVAKIRKLPNVLVRKDRDIERLKSGQEMEVVLKVSSTVAMSSGISLNPFVPPVGNSIPIPLITLPSSLTASSAINSRAEMHMEGSGATLLPLLSGECDMAVTAAPMIVPRVNGV